MQFTHDTHVFTAAGKKAGRIDRVVLDPKTKQVTHIVLHKGRLLTEDKVVPLDLIASADEHQVILRDDVEDVERLPDYMETHYIPVGEEDVLRDTARTFVTLPSFYAYPPLFEVATMPYAMPPYVAQVEAHIPEGAVALKEGAKVVTADGKRVGNIERIFTDPATNQATHFLISEGMLLTEKKLVPVMWVDIVDAEQVHLAVGARTLVALPDYVEADR